jgi:hypothetical protein
MATDPFGPAPIQRYSDPRLFGAALVNPWQRSYEEGRRALHPLHPRASQIEQVCIRALHLVRGVLAMALTFLPGLVGRVCQMIDYHSRSKDALRHPSVVELEGMSLSDFLRPCTPPKKDGYHGTSEEAALSILNWGFDLKKVSSESKMGQAVYVSTGDAVSAAYGEDQLILSFDLRPGEVAEATEAAESFVGHRGAMGWIFYQNGYRAVKYTLQSSHQGTEEAWAIYDPSCITITRINPSPKAEPQGQVLTIPS